MVVQDTEERRRKLAAAATAISPEVQALIDQSMSVGDSDDEAASVPGQQAGAEAQVLADPPSAQGAADSQQPEQPTSQDPADQLQELMKDVEEVREQEVWAQDHDTSEPRQLRYNGGLQDMQPEGAALQMHTHGSGEPVIEPHDLDADEDVEEDDDDDRPEVDPVRLSPSLCWHPGAAHCYELDDADSARACMSGNLAACRPKAPPFEHRRMQHLGFLACCC